MRDAGHQALNIPEAATARSGGEETWGAQQPHLRQKEPTNDRRNGKGQEGWSRTNDLAAREATYGDNHSERRAETTQNQRGVAQDRGGEGGAPARRRLGPRRTQCASAASPKDKTAVGGTRRRLLRSETPMALRHAFCT